MRPRIEEEVGRLLAAHRLTVAVAESCTGGLLGHRLTSVSGSSAYVVGGIIAYANRIKTGQLGVEADVLERWGAVSEPVARGMARGVKDRFETDIGIGVTGIAGPHGGTPQKPVGLVYIALSAGAKETVVRCEFSGSRVVIKRKAVRRAFELLSEYLIKRRGD